MKKRSLNFKLIFVMLILVTGSIVIAAIGMSRLALMKTSIKSIVEEKSARVSLVKDVKSLFYIQLINEKNYILEDDSAAMDSISELMTKRHIQMEDKIKELTAISSEVGKEELVRFKAVYDTWWKNIDDIKHHVKAGDDAKAKSISIGNKKLRFAGEEIIDGTVDRDEKKMAEESALMDQEYAEARNLMIAVSLFAIFLGGGIGAFVLVNLSKSIGGVIENLSSSSSQVSAASQQIATAATELSEATTEQASSLEETVATIEELSSMVKVNADNATAASKLSNETNTIAVRGEQEMQGLVDSMMEITKDSKKIADIITVIDDIAFQTNLLALNAAVEAARAGEQGKGFAVVAEAVRALSQRSSAAAKDIGDLIRSSVDRIELGSEQAKKSGTVLGDIVGAVKKVTQLNQEIASASVEQANGINQIGKAMNQLDQVTQVNAASSEEAAASAEELSAQAETLAQVIVTLVESVKGHDDKLSRQEQMTRPSLAPTRRASPVAKMPAARATKSKNNNEDLLPLDSVS